MVTGQLHSRWRETPMSLVGRLNVRQVKNSVYPLTIDH